jgi:UDP-3-O-[3-hydroxymyristoyl] glucosamine N-acyltransferase
MKTVAELALIVGGNVVGEDITIIKKVSSLESANEGDIAFIEDAKNVSVAKETKASCLIVPTGAKVEASCSLMEVAKPKLAFALIAAVLHPHKQNAPSIHPTAIVAESVKVDSTTFISANVSVGENSIIGARVQIYSGASIGENVRVGDDCILHPNAVLYDNVTLGNRVILHAGVVVGADGFGYVRDDVGYRKFPQIGTVTIEDDVEIGANTCVDRGALGETRIGKGTKIDNLVQVAHNVQIGERVVIASQTGISGSTIIESDAVIGGQVGMGDHAVVKSGAIIGSKAGVLPGKIVRAGVWWGVPVVPLEQYKKLNAHFRGLPKMKEEIDELKEQVEALTKAFLEREKF